MERSVAMTEHNRQPTMIAVDDSDALAQSRRPWRGIVSLLVIRRHILEDDNKQTCSTAFSCDIPVML